MVVWSLILVLIQRIMKLEDYEIVNFHYEYPRNFRVIGDKPNIVTDYHTNKIPPSNVYCKSNEICPKIKIGCEMTRDWITKLNEDNKWGCN